MRLLLQEGLENPRELGIIDGKSADHRQGARFLRQQLLLSQIGPVIMSARDLEPMRIEKGLPIGELQIGEVAGVLLFQGATNEDPTSSLSFIDKSGFGRL